MDLTISEEFFPPDLSDVGKQKVIDRWFAEDRRDPVFKLNVTIWGKVAMIICWYFDGNMTGKTDFKIAANLVKKLPYLFACKFDKFAEGELFELHDAIASFSHSDEDLEIVDAIVSREWKKRVRSNRKQ